MCSSDTISKAGSSSSSNSNSGISESSCDSAVKLTSVLKSLKFQLSFLQNDICDLTDKDFARKRQVNRKCVTCNKANANSRCTHWYSLLFVWIKHNVRNCD